MVDSPDSFLSGKTLTLSNAMLERSCRLVFLHSKSCFLFIVTIFQFDIYSSDMLHYFMRILAYFFLPMQSPSYLSAEVQKWWWPCYGMLGVMYMLSLSNKMDFAVFKLMQYLLGITEER